MKKKSRSSSSPEEAPLFAQLATALPSVELPEKQRESMRQRVMGSIAVCQSTDTTTVFAGDGKWISLTPLVKLKVLRVDVRAGNQTVMVRAEPGGSMPRHQHRQDEEFIVLEGECRIGKLQLRAGDAHFARAGSWHEEITTDTGVLVLVRGEYRAAVHA
ncbi:MAG TPA: cupin domain-containing protein [Steroidobacteraceae bacterium]|nr:cupin domain-containing protein [Steroidobacteraceae bacterium]